MTKVGNKDTTPRALFLCLSGVTSIILNFKVDLELLATISMLKVDRKIVGNNLPNVASAAIDLINPFLDNVLILYPQKTPENQKFSEILRGYKVGTLSRKELNLLF